MINALCVTLAGADSQGVARASTSMSRQGLAEILQVHNGAIGVWAFGLPSQSATHTEHVRLDDREACSIGPIWYRGQFGSAALQLLLDALDRQNAIDESALRGNFVVFLRASRRCILMNDALGFVGVYLSHDKKFYSTSWLATCAYAGHVELDDGAAIEYVLLGATHSDHTPARGVTTLPLASGIDLVQGRVFERPRTWTEPSADPSVRALEASIDRIGAHLGVVFSEIATAFGSKVRAALSGGFDSRLIVAGLLRSGCRPELFVYGNSQSTDVAIARSVAHSVDLPLNVIDKDGCNRHQSLATLERLVDAALFFDGLPNDGIYDVGTDQATRLDQNAQGWIALNGGGGEIFRNYFHLPARRFSALDVVRAFYRGFDPKVFRDRGALEKYEARLATSMLKALGTPAASIGQPIDRAQVELLYPLFRCHHWMAINNSVGVRHGYYGTPLIDPETVRLSWQLPLPWKNAGKLESRLIRKLHRGIAEPMSEYGFAFTDGPHWRAQLAAWAGRARPVFLRPAINAVGRHVRRQSVPPVMLAHGRALLPGEWLMDPLLDVALLPDAQALARALAIEIAWRHAIG